jgi:hypothetical protein
VEQDEKLNRLLHGQGSIAHRTQLAKELDDDRLQIAAPYSPQAKEELERRRDARALHQPWYARPVGMTVLAVAASVIAAVIAWYFGLV